MEIALLRRESEFEWHIPQTESMKVPGIIYATKELVSEMDTKVVEQMTNVAMLPGIQKASFAMPDAHWGYGFPIGGVAAFDPEEEGVVSAGGVGFDVSCGVRTLLTGVTAAEIESVKEPLADALYETIPAGVGSTGRLHLNAEEMDAMLTGGAKWAVDQGYGLLEDLERIEEQGQMREAKPGEVSEQAKKRQRDEVGTLGSGNHYLEVQRVDRIYEAEVAAAFGLSEGNAVLSIHCGSRGLGHQIGTDFLKRMVIAAPSYGITLPDRELACAPIRSDLGQSYLGAMRAAINCALANREVITHLAREAFARILPNADLKLIYDVSHNTCKVEEHALNGEKRSLFVHRKGATRAFGPGHPELPAPLAQIGQPVLIGGTMGTASYILVGTVTGEARSFSSSCHGAGRRMSRHQATKLWKGRAVIDDLAGKGILIRSPSSRGVAEEAPGAYKDVSVVVDAAEKAGLSKKVARVTPMICIKG